MANTKLTRTLSGNGNQNTATWSFWVKRSGLTDARIYNSWYDGNNQFWIMFSSNKFNVKLYQSSSYSVQVETNRLFRDPSGWMHIVVAIDTTQSTASDRVKIYVNGVQETSLNATTYPSQNQSMPFGLASYNQRIGFRDAEEYFDGSMSHFHFCDGTALAPTVFGETDSTTGEWKIKTSPSFTLGTNGFTILKDGNTITDQSTNSNNWTLAAGTLTKTEDNPSNVFATLNPLVNTPADTGSLSNGSNTYTTSNYSYNTRSTLGMTSGKFYWEQKVNNATAVKVGLCTSQYDPSLDTDSSTAHYGGTGGGGVYVLMSNSTTTWQFTNSDTSKNTGSYTNAIASTSSSILMGAVDVDAGKLWVGVDGVWMNSGNPATGANAQITFTNSSPDALHIMASHGDNASRATSWNFGNGYFGTTAISSEGSNASGIGKFEYDVPTGYTALSTKGLNL